MLPPGSEKQGIPQPVKEGISLSSRGSLISGGQNALLSYCAQGDFQRKNERQPYERAGLGGLRPEGQEPSVRSTMDRCESTNSRRA